MHVRADCPNRCIRQHKPANCTEDTQLTQLALLVIERTGQSRFLLCFLRLFRFAVPSQPIPRSKEQGLTTMQAVSRGAADVAERYSAQWRQHLATS